MIHVTRHAADRYYERVEVCPDPRAAILAHAIAIERAALAGSRCVRLGNGARLVLDGLTVVTVYRKGDMPRQIKWRAA